MENRTLEKNQSILRRYSSRKQDLYQPTPTSSYLSAILMLLETPYISPHILSIIEAYSSKQVSSPDIHDNETCPRPIGETETSRGGHQYVYIIPRIYLQNWLTWVSHQIVPDQEKDRLNMAVLMVSALYEIEMGAPKGTVESPTLKLENNSSMKSSPKQGKTKASKKSKKKKHSSQSHNGGKHIKDVSFFPQKDPSLNVSEALSYPDPGPMDSTSLSTPGRPFLLRPNVTLHRNSTLSIDGQYTTNEDPKRVNLDCVAVPESFYEYIRRVHGVICEDGSSISFQPCSLRSKDEFVLSHFQCLPYSNHDSIEIGVDHELANRINRLDVNREDTDVLEGPRKSNLPQPVEFRRRVGSTSRRVESSFVADIETAVELYPYQFYYRITHKSISDGDIEKIKEKSSDQYDWNRNELQLAHGCVLLSRFSTIQSAFRGVLNCVLPDGNADCVRLWYDSRKVTYRHNKKMGPTFMGDGFEQVYENSDSELSVDEWVNQRIGSSLETCLEVHLLVEMRSSLESPWPRKLLELSNRIQVGDFVDAQGSNGIWYEAVVREVTEHTVRVHFCGWSSKWDRIIRRYSGDECVLMCCKTTEPPYALWTKTSRWRDMIRVGDLVELRDSSSAVERPQWHRGLVKWVGDDDDMIHHIIGGAELEVLDYDENEMRAPLLLLHRKRQILVQVERDLTFETSMKNEESRFLDTSTVPSASPPYLRWVNLYGEEICRWNTHLRPKTSEDVNVDKGHGMVEILRSKVPALGKRLFHDNVLGSPVANGSVGLYNLGNTCYMNAILQCLNQIELFTAFFLKGDHLKDINKMNPLGSKGQLAMAYGSLIEKIWIGKYTHISPEDLRLTFAKFAPQFNNTYQHDCHEFCCFFLDALHEDLNRVKDKPYVEDIEGLGMDCDAAAVASWRNYLKRHDSIFVDHCHGMQRSHLSCPQCGKESIKFDVYSSLSLSLDYTQHQNTLFNCLDKFTEGEELDVANGWYCSKCQKHVCAKKKIQIWTTPDILIFHLKRFTFKASESKKHGLVRSKIQHVVNFPIDRLDLHKYVHGPKDESAPPIYKLLGVAEHSGSTTTSGHYTATVRNMTNGLWYHFNDTHVGVTTAEAAISKGSYLLFFERSYGKSRWAGMEKLIEGINKPLTDSEGFTIVSAKKKKKGAI